MRKSIENLSEWVPLLQQLFNRRRSPSELLVPFDSSVIPFEDGILEKENMDR